MNGHDVSSTRTGEGCPPIQRRRTRDADSSAETQLSRSDTRPFVDTRRRGGRPGHGDVGGTDVTNRLRGSDSERGPLGGGRGKGRPGRRRVSTPTIQRVRSVPSETKLIQGSHPPPARLVRASHPRGRVTTPSAGVSGTTSTFRASTGRSLRDDHPLRRVSLLPPHQGSPEPLRVLPRCEC